jgi:broad specificity phosphatase PhoE
MMEAAQNSWWLQGWRRQRRRNLSWNAITSQVSILCNSGATVRNLSRVQLVVLVNLHCMLCDAWCSSNPDKVSNPDLPHLHLNPRPHPRNTRRSTQFLSIIVSSSPLAMSNTTTTADKDASSLRTQKVVLMRHGVAQHNLWVDGQPPNLRDPRLFDPPLTYQGKQQAMEAGERLRIWYQTTQLGDTPELVVVSPLTRCLQTATLAFLPGDKYTTQMKEPRWAGTELCREAFGMHYPDRRRDLSILKQHWPVVQWDSSMTESDTAWRSDARETIPGLMQRISQFWDFMAQRPEECIVVVTHGVWIEACFHQYYPAVLDHGRRRVYNCDMFAMNCLSHDRKFVRLENSHQIGV